MNTIKRALKFFNYLFHCYDKAWKMKHGYIPRGRSNVVLGRAETFPAGRMGGSVVNVTTSLKVRHFRKNPVTGKHDEVIQDRREVLNRKVTTVFVNDIVDNLITEVAAFGDYKWHDSGTDNTGESPSDTGLGTPCGESRTSGTQIEGAQTYEYKSVATHTYAGTFTIVEHGLFNNSAGGILMDRTVFAGIGVGSGDKIEFTFTIQFSAEA